MPNTFTSSAHVTHAYFYILILLIIIVSKLLIGLAIGIAASMIGTCLYMNCRKKKNDLKNTDVDVDLDLSKPIN